MGVEKVLDSKKVLQAVNLSPSESSLEKISQVHPMKQIAFASVLQVIVFFGMLGSFWGIDQVVGNI